MRHSNIEAVTKLMGAAHQVQVDRAQHALCNSRARGRVAWTFEHADQTSNGDNAALSLHVVLHLECRGG